MQDVATTSEYERGVEAGRAEMLALIDTVHAVAPDLLPALGPRSTLARLAEILLHYDAGQLAILRPFDVVEALTVKEAARIAGCTPRTIAQWSDRYRIGRLVVGALRISHPALLALLDDDALALGCLLMGLRQHPSVGPYLARCGLAMAA